MTSASRACGACWRSRRSSNSRPRTCPRSAPRFKPHRMLAGRTIIVTGAARGVGRAIARACAKAGARLVLGDILEDAGRAVAEELARMTEARFVPIDLDDPESIKAFARDVGEREGRVHG